MKPEEWIVSGDRGMSSETIWAVMMGTRPERPSTPWDPDDFGRCHRLLMAIPEWRERLPEVAAVYPEWTALVEHWDEMVFLYLRDLPTGRCEELYSLMQKLNDEGRTAAGWVQISLGSWMRA